MPRKAKKPELVRISGVAEILGVAGRTAARHANRKDFPKPAAVFNGGGRVWRRVDVEKWARKPPVPLDRGPGRPKKS